MKAAALWRRVLLRATLAAVTAGCVVVTVIGFAAPAAFHRIPVTPTPPGTTLSSSQR
ncbi:hypothetical protein [Amycolatopsis benzoatilytica]|uniref:hypothetical protein n=1 Tax=Amycolatopsis benzoatilytica TaxID=346045 RepID=UPI000367D1FA|nr:hypothetical protein [Amycolatopsis benzoatilytica]